MAADTARIAADLAPTGVLRASINLGNPVLAQGTPEAPSGITVDLAQEFAARLGLPLDLVCFEAARESFQAIVDGRADLGFLAVEPAREAEIAFTEPYVLIEGVFAVPRDSSFATPADVDRDGVRIGVKEGSAYDLYLTRTLQHATLVRGAEGTTVFAEQGLDVAAGIRQPVTAFAERHDANGTGLRVIDQRFMEIRQAVGTTRSRKPETVEFLRSVVEELKADGSVEESLRRSGQVATPAS